MGDDLHSSFNVLQQGRCGAHEDLVPDLFFGEGVGVNVSGMGGKLREENGSVNECACV